MTTSPSSDASPSGPRLRQVLDDIASYVPGRAAAPSAHKLSSNENPYPPLPSVQQAVVAATADINRYPDLAAVALVEAIAARFDVAPECIAVGTGSVGVLQQLVQITCGPGDEVLFAWRSFEAYPIVTRISGADAVTVPVTPDGRHDLAAMAAAITERTRLVLVCSPNNPTGTAVHHAELETFLDAVPRDVLVVLDEAYVEFVRDPEAMAGLLAFRERPNVTVLRTFSKAYGLAGLRVGFAVAHPAVAAALRKTAVPFGVSAIAQVAAVASLAAEDELLVRVAALVAQRDRVVGELRAQGWQLPDAEANFVWLATGSDTAEFAAHCEHAGVIVRPFSPDGCRVTIAGDAANDRFLAAAGQWLARSSGSRDITGSGQPQP